MAAVHMRNGGHRPCRGRQQPLEPALILGQRCLGLLVGLPANAPPLDARTAALHLHRLDDIAIHMRHDLPAITLAAHRRQIRTFPVLLQTTHGIFHRTAVPELADADSPTRQQAVGHQHLFVRLKAWRRMGRHRRHAEACQQHDSQHRSCRIELVHAHGRVSVFGGGRRSSGTISTSTWW